MRGFRRRTGRGGLDADEPSPGDKSAGLEAGREVDDRGHHLATGGGARPAKTRRQPRM
jgi:hypothetical protein